MHGWEGEVLVANTPGFLASLGLEGLARSNARRLVTRIHLGEGAPFSCNDACLRPALAKHNQRHSGELVRDFAELIWGKKLGGERAGGGSGGPGEPRTAVPACVVGVGVNCTAPTHIAGALRILSDTVKSHARNGDTTINISTTSSHREGEDTTLGKKCLSEDCGNPSSPALVAYPNSGEDWDAAGKDWVKGTGFRGGGGVGELGQLAREWFADTEASVFGGCCRTRPAHITEIREALLLESGGAFLEATS